MLHLAPLLGHQQLPRYLSCLTGSELPESIEFSLNYFSFFIFHFERYLQLDFSVSKFINLKVFSSTISHLETLLKLLLVSSSPFIFFPFLFSQYYVVFLSVECIFIVHSACLPWISNIFCMILWLVEGTFETISMVVVHQFYKFV